MAKHSPGPWRWIVVEDGDSWLMHSGPDNEGLDAAVLVAEAKKWPPGGDDARLIATAPQMYRLLEHVARHGSQERWANLSSEARALLARIDGSEREPDAGPGESR